MQTYLLRHDRLPVFLVVVATTMIWFIALSIIVVSRGESAINAGYRFTGTEPRDMEYSRSWAGPMFERATTLPISFDYNNQKTRGIPEDWLSSFNYERIDANLFYKVFEGKDPQTGLVLIVEVWEYQDYPVVEWVAWFSNEGDEPTPILKGIHAIDVSFDGLSPILHHNNGDYYSESGYTPMETPIIAGDRIHFSPRGGRSSDGAFPYFRVGFEDRGLNIAIGWPGQWYATFAGTENGVNMIAGQERTHLRLMPGEKIRTPRITVMSWMGDESRAVNLWRRWYLDHVLPKPDGNPVAPLLATAFTDPGEEFTSATEENQLRYMQQLKNAGIDYDVWLIDAGWYPSRNEQGQRTWWHVGTWEPEVDRFPNGFTKLADLGKEIDSKLWIWFEPERVYAGSKIDVEMPECLLTLGGPFGSESPNSLFNFGNEDCREWITDQISGFVTDNGVAIYRHDFNIEPLEYWRRNEGVGRQGITENLYVQGLLKFFDELLIRNPGLLIDNCASGGRRNDLEMMRRSVPLHYSDYGYGFHGIKLGFHHTLYTWLPYFKDATITWEPPSPPITPDKFAIYSGMAPMMIITDRGLDQVSDAEVLLIRIWREAAQFMIYGDYYLLTPFSKDNRSWVVRQFNAPEMGSGIIQAFRHFAAIPSRMTVHLNNLDPQITYVLTNYETEEQLFISGESLMNDGLTLQLRPRSGGIWFYHRVPPETPIGDQDIDDQD